MCFKPGKDTTLYENEIPLDKCLEPVRYSSVRKQNATGEVSGTCKIQQCRKSNATGEVSGTCKIQQCRKPNATGEVSGTCKIQQCTKTKCHWRSIWNL
jgi:hypothetical protein